MNNDKSEEYLLNKIKQKRDKKKAHNIISNIGFSSIILVIMVSLGIKYVLIKRETKKSSLEIEALLTQIYSSGNFSSQLESDIQETTKSNANLLVELKELQANLNGINNIISSKLRKEVTQDNRSDNEEMFTSDIINSYEEGLKITKWTDGIYVGSKRIYYANYKNNTYSAFHEKCDEKYPTVVLIETENEMRFGGFTRRNWSKTQDHIDTDSFIFSLTGEKKYMPNDQGILASQLVNNKTCLLSFGTDIVVGENVVSSMFPNAYGNKSNHPFEILGMSEIEKLKTIEVFTGKDVIN